jgi:hypothetical protein
MKMKIVQMVAIFNCPSRGWPRSTWWECWNVGVLARVRNGFGGETMK